MITTVTRRRLIEVGRVLRDQDAVPPLVDNPEICINARSGDLFAPAGQHGSTPAGKSLAWSREAEL